MPTEPEVTARMHRAPDDWEETVRWASERARGGNPEGLETLLSALRWRYETARNSAIEAIVALDPPPVAAVLRVLQSAETAVERGAAARALGFLGLQESIPPLKEALRDPNMVVRRFAMAALWRMGASEAVPQIIERLQDESGGVRVLAADILGKFRDSRAVLPLLQVLRDPKWYVRQAGARALGEIGDKRAIEGLQRLVKDSRPAVSRAARASLEALLT